MDYVYSTMTNGEMQANLNSGKEVLAARLLKDKIITKEIYDTIINEYAIIVVRKGWLGQTLDKLFNLNDSNSAVTTVKI